MAPKLRSGLLITLEGGEGSGKSSQAEALAQLLRADEYQVTLTREPTGTELGQAVMDLFRRNATAGAEAELFLFAAARAQHVQEVIRPALERGEVVICDRFTDSTLAYQGYGRGLDLDHVRAVNLIATGGLSPHFTILLDVSPEIGLSRKDHERLKDSIGGETEEFHRNVRQGFLELAREAPQRVAIVDASLPAGQVKQAMLDRLRGFLDTLS